MGMRKFGSAAPPFSKVACAVKVFKADYLILGNYNPIALETPLVRF